MNFNFDLECTDCFMTECGMYVKFGIPFISQEIQVGHAWLYLSKPSKRRRYREDEKIFMIYGIKEHFVSTDTRNMKSVIDYSTEIVYSDKYEREYEKIDIREIAEKWFGTGENFGLIIIPEEDCPLPGYIKCGQGSPFVHIEYDVPGTITGMERVPATVNVTLNR